VQPPKTWAELKATAKKLTSSKQYGLAFNDGLAKVDHQSVPGPTLIQKVLQQASSKTLPDVLMLDAS